MGLPTESSHFYNQLMSIGRYYLASVEMVGSGPSLQLLIMTGVKAGFEISREPGAFHA